MVGAPGPAWIEDEGRKLSMQIAEIDGWPFVKTSEYNTYLQIMPRVCSNRSPGHGWQYPFVQGRNLLERACLLHGFHTGRHQDNLPRITIQGLLLSWFDLVFQEKEEQNIVHSWQSPTLTARGNTVHTEDMVQHWLHSEALICVSLL